MGHDREEIYTAFQIYPFVVAHNSVNMVVHMVDSLRLIHPTVVSVQFMLFQVDKVIFQALKKAE